MPPEAFLSHSFALLFLNLSCTLVEGHARPMRSFLMWKSNKDVFSRVSGVWTRACVIRSSYVLVIDPNKDNHRETSRCCMFLSVFVCREHGLCATHRFLYTFLRSWESFCPFWECFILTSAVFLVRKRSCLCATCSLCLYRVCLFIMMYFFLNLLPIR